MPRNSIIGSLLNEYDSPGYAPIKGVDYFDGKRGADGREVELSRIGSEIKWRYIGDATWYTLVTLDEITGEQGEQGEPGPAGPRGPQGVMGEQGAVGPEGRRVELRLSQTHLQWGSATATNDDPGTFGELVQETKQKLVPMPGMIFGA